MSSYDGDILAGELKHPISIRIKPTTRAANGEIDNSLTGTSSWTVRCSPRASVTFLKGIELIRSDRDASETWVTFGIRYRAALPIESDRIIWRSRVFDIISVSQVAAENTRVELQTKEVK